MDFKIFCTKINLFLTLFSIIFLKYPCIPKTDTIWVASHLHFIATLPAISLSLGTGGEKEFLKISFQLI